MRASATPEWMIMKSLRTPQLCTACKFCELIVFIPLWNTARCLRPRTGHMYTISVSILNMQYVPNRVFLKNNQKCSLGGATPIPDLCPIWRGHPSKHPILHVAFTCTLSTILATPLFEPRCSCNIRKNLFAERVANVRNIQPSTIDFSTLASFRRKMLVCKM